VEEHKLPVRRACVCVGLCRSAYYRQPQHWTVRDAELIAALAKLVEGRPNRGFWMCRKQLRRQGRPWNHKRIYRVYKLMRLNLRRAAKRRLPKRERVALYVPRHPNTVWSADFMSDALSCGRRFRLFNVVDDFNREALHIEVDTSITSERLVRIFEQLRCQRPLPQVLRTDNVLNASRHSSKSNKHPDRLADGGRPAEQLILRINQWSSAIVRGSLA
jgi:putative transposase